MAGVSKILILSDLFFLLHAAYSSVQRELVGGTTRTALVE